MLRRLGAQTRQVRQPEELRGLDGLVIPGGESTTFCRLMEDFGFYEPLRAVIKRGMPVWGTCAGMIVLARRASDLDFPTLGAIDIEVLRNAYGRQVDSFEADLHVKPLGGPPFRAVFIRAPVVERVGPGVDVLATVETADGRKSPVAVQEGAVICTSFHPELSEDTRFHEYFLHLVRSEGVSASPK